MKQRGQDDLTRRRRLNGGLCPTHGIPLQYTTIGSATKVQVFCPRDDCDFEAYVTGESKVWKAMSNGQ